MHRKIQRRMGSGYQAEVSLRHSVEEDGFQIVVEGRADGIIRDGKDVTIDEIKCVYQDVNCLEEAVGALLWLYLWITGSAGRSDTAAHLL